MIKIRQNVHCVHMGKMHGRAGRSLMDNDFHCRRIHKAWLIKATSSEVYTRYMGQVGNVVSQYLLSLMNKPSGLPKTLPESHLKKKNWRDFTIFYHNLLNFMRQLKPRKDKWWNWIPNNFYRVATTNKTC